MQNTFDDSLTKIRTRILKRKRFIPVPFLTIILLYVATFVSSASSYSVNEILQEPTPLHNGAFQLLDTGNDTTVLLNLSENLFSNRQTIHVKPTSSAVYCDTNAIDLPIIYQNDTKFLISISDFNFNEHNVAYLCLNIDGTEPYYHLGSTSQFGR